MVPGREYGGSVFRVKTVVVLVAVGCVAACGASPSTPASRTAQPMPAARSSEPALAVASSRAVPQTPWDRLLAEGKPGDELTAARAGLASSYLPDRGEDDYRKPRKQRIRRDLAAYLLRVRDQDPEAADALGWQLQAIPSAWCSLVLPARTPADFDRQLDTANRRGQELARALGVTFTPPVSARKHRVLVQARQAAAGQFCPAQAGTPGKPVSASVAPPAGFPDGTGPVNILETALPEHYAPNWSGAGTPTIRAQDLRQAYVDILAGTARVNLRAWPTALSCDQVADLLRPAELQEYAVRLREGFRDGWLSRRKAASDATGFAADTFVLLERRRACG